MANNSQRPDNKSTAVLWSVAGALALGLLLARVVWPELLVVTIVLVVALIGVSGLLIRQNRIALKSRSAAYGLNSAVTILLVIGIVGVVNFMASRYPQKLDLTKNKLHTLSDQTVKVVKGLTKPVKVTLFSKLPQREQYRPLLENYRNLNPKFEIEYIDPDREPLRATQAGIRKYGTLVLTAGTRTSTLDDINEEKLTNALIKALKEKAPTLCAITGHGEKSFTSQEQDGYEAVRRGLVSQSYEVKDVAPMQETQIPAVCDAIAIIGPTKAFFPQEVKMIREYLTNGGRAVIATDIHIKGPEGTPELNEILADWNITAVSALIVDPASRMSNADPSMPIVNTYSPESPITKDFHVKSILPFARPLEIIPGAPSELKVTWLAQTSPSSFGVTDLKQLATGQVRYTEGKDKRGPMTVAISVDGKKKESKATRNTRIVVFGTSIFANNNSSRFGGNLDFFMNAASWIMEDESLISIRAKEDGPGRVEMSDKTQNFIALLSMILLPLSVAVAGAIIWFRRKKL